MKKIMALFVVVALLSVTVTPQAFAGGGGGYHHGGSGLNPLWPLAVVAVAATIARAVTPPPVVAQPVVPAPRRVYVAPPVNYGPNAYHAPAPRGYYTAPGHYYTRTHRGW